MSYAYEIRLILGTDDRDEAQRKADLIDSAISEEILSGNLSDVEWVEAEGLYEF